MKKGYKFAIAWIALNDSPGDNENAETMAGYVSVLLVADLFGKDQNQVAKDVFQYRQTHHR